MTSGWGLPELLSEKEKQAFLNWIKAQYGSWRWAHFRPMSDKRIAESPEYKYWRKYGRPSKSVTPLTPEQEKEVITELETRLTPLLKDGEIPFESLKSGDKERLEALGWKSVTKTSPFGAKQVMTPPAAPPPKEDAGEHPPKIESIDGYDFRMTWDGTLKRYVIADPTPIGLTSERDAPQRAWQLKQEQLGISRAELGQREADIRNQAWLAQKVAEANAYEREALRQGTWSQKREEDIRDEERRGMAETFEQWRNTILSGTAPRDWIIREKAKAAANPFQAPERSLEGERQAVKESYDLAKEEVKNAQESYNDLTKRATDNAPGYPSTWEIDIAKQRLDAANTTRNDLFDKLKDFAMMTPLGKKLNPEYKTKTNYWGIQSDVEEELAWSAPRPSVIGGGYEVGRPTSYEPRRKPELPAEIRPYVSTSEFGGEIAPPSEAQFTTMPWSSQEKLLGYQVGIGGYEGDLLSQIRARSPSAPDIAYRWSPTRQR